MLLQIIILHNTKNPHNFYRVIFTELEKIQFCNFLFVLPAAVLPSWLVYKLNISPNCGRRGGGDERRN